MPSPYTQQKIENWTSDFCLSDGIRSFPPELRDHADAILTTFLTAACEPRDIDPADLEDPDIKISLLGTTARLNLPHDLLPQVPALIAAFLTDLQSQGRLSGGRVLGAMAKALTQPYLDAATGKPKPITRPGAKLGRNDPCPCGSGKKYKKCCLKE